MPAGKLGKLPPDPTKPRLRLSSLLPDLETTPVPDEIDYVTGVDEWPMYLNDRLGICVFAGIGHAIEAATRFGQGTAVLVSDDAVLKGYEDVAGYVPGDPSTDNGTVVQEALSYWRKTGIGGDRIVAFASVDVTNTRELAAALYYFGHVIIGFTVTESAMAQFDAGKPWDVSKRPGQVLGGHCITIGYDSTSKRSRKGITWAAVQEMTDAFFATYVDEAWCVVTQDWVNKTSGHTPIGMDLAAFGAAFASLTGQANPFPDAPPVDPPVDPPVPPIPPPVEPPVVDAALAPLMRRLSKHPFHRLSKMDRLAIREWLDAWGF